MSTRARRPGRRTWVYVGDPLRQTSCTIWGQQHPRGRWADRTAHEHRWDVTRRAHAYEMTCVLKLPKERDLDIMYAYRGEFPRDVQRGLDIASLIRGDVTYAFYSRPSHAVKIGRTTNILQRWAKLENESGQLRQLLSVWHHPSSRDMERELHERWAQHRTVGEWFTADPVLADLGQMATVTKEAA